jgi:multidrug efflux pump subunit AcrA (membrane-fusion protein)
LKTEKFKFKAMRKIFITSVVAVSVSLAGCGGSVEEGAGNQNKEVVKGFETTKIQKELFSDSYEATGTVNAKLSTTISATTMGRIIALPINEGMMVSKGQLLAEINGREAASQKKRAEAALTEAEAGLAEVDQAAEGSRAGLKSAESQRDLADRTAARIESLYEKKSVSLQELDEARARQRAAASEVERAKAGVAGLAEKRKQALAKIEQVKAEINTVGIYQGYARITSPVAGVVVKKHMDIGATASPGMPIVTVEDSSAYRLEVAVEESKSSSIRLGGAVIVSIESAGLRELDGRISEIVPVTNPNSRTYTVKIDLPSGSLLRSGFFGTARFPQGQREVIAVPGQSVTMRGQLSGVFLVGADGVARFRIVRTGKSSDGKIEILSGLSEGEEVVANPNSSLNDGVKIR